SDLAEADFNRAIEMSRTIGYRHGEAVYQMNLGILHVIKNQLGAALTAFDQAATTYSDIGNGRGRALVLANSAWIRHANLGDNERAEQETAEAYTVYEQIGDIRGRAQCLVVLGSIKAESGFVEEGRRLLEDGVALTLEAEDSWLAAQALRELASVELAAGLAEAGIAHATKAEGLCEQIGMNDLRVGIKALRGRLLLEAGQVDQALRVTAEAMADLHPGVELAYRVPFAHGLALAAAGRLAEADSYLELAHEHLTALLSDLSEPDRATALSIVPAHRQVIEAWTRRRPRRTAQRLARLGVPTGRPLADHEWVSVTWTLQVPADDQIGNPVERRRRRLLRLLAEAAAQGGAPTVDDLAPALAASVATVRRDLAALRRLGHPAVTRGTRGAPAS
ncbi:MAG: DUF1670 domain-containing protein, partial [Actinomycetota bacterium]